MDEMTELVELHTEYGTDFAIEDESVAIYHMNEERLLWLTKKDLLTMLELIEKENQTNEIH
jgi:hypothetical protein